jgi:hypothetical protein
VRQNSGVGAKRDVFQEKKGGNFSITLAKIWFVVVYSHYYLSKISELKNQVSKLIFSNLINYFVICCQNGKDTIVLLWH